MKGLIIFLLLFTNAAFAFNARTCAQNVWMKKGWFREYSVKYSSIEFISSKTSTEEGSTKTSSASSTESSSMSSDPGVTTGQTESTSQWSSSQGDCALWATNSKWLRREFYIAENLGSIRKNASQGQGEYLDVLVYLSGCPASHAKRLSQELHDKYKKVFNESRPAWDFSSSVDTLIEGNKELSKACDNFPVES
ncbi:MAG: hypothetical protein A2504_10515 [Bdellovibrionales bacterium RIFOXYD12_FULL_39_22]|nr:MAG: hypothetical protein A2385_14150 [Bdellovibrionales bacterium RIFOXYB1_FULL_39_21]OFZ40377.1 MAG: hypothetical protein A2485_02840 [Bdellovibrionales bacterium RIFOXYC12_FULL_39_17]OFZ49626.1 MAG: hypothetical protein A2404_09300 [Bdellovibrionales bacterium RIFOXYC1_FULL_39_130]OFZ72363.1 MAG: hypothetical protein A2451_14610 [Bdellovibrionales bacterium RIFOXYC2_FULL_39_8]OFZ77296.1 MAG: hypothetical protein A2560_05965 [Bdellovibrionales bacterium RIFOXYD1_FULL_39_84]OFZ95951.1 MAG: